MNESKKAELIAKLENRKKEMAVRLERQQKELSSPKRVAAMKSYDEGQKRWHAAHSKKLEHEKKVGERKEAMAHRAADKADPGWWNAERLKGTKGHSAYVKAGGKRIY